MKKLFIAVAIAAASVTPQAFAQAKNFEGFSLIGALNANNNTVDVTVTTPASTASESKTASNVGVQAEYNFAIGDAFVMGVGASAGLSKYDIANSVSMKNSYSIYITPGFAVNNNFMVYGKLASASATIESGATSIDISGIGYGFGGRYFSSKNVFFQAEYLYNKYDDKKMANGMIQNKTGVLSFGVGYKF
jgi:opacity protein-like surface antigen